ncbi:MAG: ABC transporter substrate-binding protein [Chloroflexi bacterium]|nr:ABC transporter substrate-binding protein [Chloroflexota bacterium]
MEAEKIASKRRVSRRDFLTLTGAAVVPLLAACATAAPSPAAAPTAAPKAAAPTAAAAAPAPTAAQPAKPTATVPAAAAATAAPTKPAVAIKRGGTLVQATAWTYPSLDPIMTTVARLPAHMAISNSLVNLELVDPKTWEHKVVGDLAESWEQPDPTTIVFKLKKGVTFHDGSDFDAEVAKWNLLRARDHAKSQLKTQLTVLASAEALDKSTLRLKLKTPNPAFLRSLAFENGAKVQMSSKVALEKLGDDGFARSPVGTGPFKFKQWITDDRVILERNPNYHVTGADGKALPYLDGLVFRYVPDPAVALVDMRAGSAHILDRVPAKDFATIKNDPNLAVWEMPWAGQGYFWVGFNTKKPPFDNVRLRQAAVQAIDRVGMAKALGFGIGIPHYYPHWAPGSLGYDESITKNDYNPAKVKELLKEAGFPDGISTDLKIIGREPDNTIGEFAQQMWTAVGIKTKLVAQERVGWIDSLKNGDFQAAFWGGTFDVVVDPDVLKRRVVCEGAANWSQFCDKDIDRLMDEAGQALDPKKRHELYRDVIRIIQEKAYLGSGINMQYIWALRKELQGITASFQVPDFSAAWIK